MRDMPMKPVDGLHAAGQIRRMDEKVGIIFLTTLAQYGLAGYKYQAEDCPDRCKVLRRLAWV